MKKCSKAMVLLSALVEVAAADLHVATSLLRICGSYCKLVHLARTTPPSLSFESLQFFDEAVRHCISRNGPYIGGHLAFYFKLNFKQIYNVL